MTDTRTLQELYEQKKLMLDQVPGLKTPKVPTWRASEKGLLSRKSKNINSLFKEHSTPAVQSHSMPQSPAARFTKYYPRKHTRGDKHDHIKMSERVSMLQTPLEMRNRSVTPGSRSVRIQVGTEERRPDSRNYYSHSSQSVGVSRQSDRGEQQQSILSNVSSFARRLEEVGRAGAYGGQNYGLKLLKEMHDSSKSVGRKSTRQLYKNPASTVQLVKTILRPNKKSYPEIERNYESAYHSNSITPQPYSSIISLSSEQDSSLKKLEGNASDELVRPFAPPHIGQKRSSSRILNRGSTLDLSQLIEIREETNPQLSDTQSQKIESQREEVKAAHLNNTKLFLDQVLQLHQETTEDIQELEGIRFEIDINFYKNFAKNKGSSFIGQEYAPSSDTPTVAKKRSSTSQFYSQNLQELDSLGVFPASVAGLRLEKVPRDMRILYQNIKSSLRKNLKKKRDVEFYEREVLLKHIREQTRLLRSVIQTIVGELWQRGGRNKNMREIGFMLAVMLDLFWKNTVAKFD